MKEHPNKQPTIRNGKFIERDELKELVRSYRERKFAEDVDWFGEREQDVERWAEANLRVNTTTGLKSNDDFTQREEIYGSNRRPEKEMMTFFQLMWAAMQDLTLIILSVLGTISLIIGLTLSEHPETEWIEGFAILIAVVIVVIVTATNDYQKAKKFAELQRMHKNRQGLNFLRDGRFTTLHPSEAQVGDVIELTPGCICPVDGLVIKSNSLQANEAALTGENDDVEKDTPAECMIRMKQYLDGHGSTTDPHANREIPSPIVISGSSIAEGTGLIVAVCVGSHSTEGQISDLTEQEDEQTPLEFRLDDLANRISKIGLIMGAVCVIVLYIRFFIELAVGTIEWDTGDSIAELLEYIIIAITVLVVAIPEGLPLAVTISLAYSVKKMQVDRNLVKRLHACETMGGSNSICSDKTGTLTQNQMLVEMVCIDRQVYHKNEASQLLDKNPEYFAMIRQCIELTTTARIDTDKEGRDIEMGSKTELALIKLLIEKGHNNYENVRMQCKHHIVHTNPFSSKRKRNSIVVQYESDHRRVYVIGASEYVLGSCTGYYGTSGTSIAIEDAERKEFEDGIEKMASSGLRTLAIAFRDLESDEPYNEINDEGIPVLETRDLYLIALFGIKDPPRPEVPGAIQKCNGAGIKVRMVTGDNKTTARHIAKQIGILSENGTVMEGEEFRKLVGGIVCEKCRTYECDCPRKATKENSDVRNDVVADMDAFRRHVGKLDVLARSQPEDKYTLVTGLKQMGDVVAVTGDGTNDAPALKKANIGFAMGIAGTELAREAADIILLDDNFSSIVKAVMWGRNIYDAIQKFLQFQLTVNVGAVASAIVGAVTIKQSPLTPVQMLWVNLIMDTLASLALATEPPTERLLERRPIRATAFIITPLMFKHIFGQAFWQCVIMFVLMFAGEWMLPEYGEGEDILYNPEDDNFVRSGRFYKIDGEEDYEGLFDEHGPSRHFTYIFNIFVLLQLFNELNSRKIRDERWVLEGFFRNAMFLVIWIITIIAQVILVSFGREALACHYDGLTWEQWLISVAVAFTALLWRFVLLPLPGIRINHFHKHDEDEDALPPDPKQYHPEQGIKKSLTNTFKGAAARKSSNLHF